MGKMLVIIAVVWLLFVLLRRQVRPSRPEPRIRDVRTVRCAHCGLHLPEQDAVKGAGLDYCSPEHRQLGPRGS